jgi:uncharacterized protein YggT (Ycf19 family)
MRPISTKKILIILLVLIVMSRWDKISAVASGVYQFIIDALEPLRNSPPEGQLAVASLILALIYITIFKLLYDRNRK